MSVKRSGGRILVDQLALHGVRHAFGVPGESYLDVIDALRDSAIEFTICRNEGGAAMMAEAAGKLGPLPGIVLVTRGPGATNAAHGLHIAQQDSTPLIMFVGQVARSAKGRDAFQELDYNAVFGSIAKWVVEIDDAARIPELIARAFRTAVSGRPGPVVVALPEDMLRDQVTVPDANPFLLEEASPSPDDMRKLADLLSKAERPVAILGGSRWSEEATQQFARFAEEARIPVYCSFRRQALFAGEHSCYGGDLSIGANPSIVKAIKEADVVLLVGGRLSEVPSQDYSLLAIPTPAQALVHVYPGAEEIGRLYQPTLAFNLSPKGFCAALATGSFQSTSNSRAVRVADAHAAYLAWSDPTKIKSPGKLQMAQLVAHLQRSIPANSILCNGAGNYAVWHQRFWRFSGFGTQLAPTSGSMGYCVPSAVGAKKLYPDRTVIAFAGDGCFLMNGQEFATAIQYSLPIVVIVIDNGMYGTIRMHQERHYPGRVASTDLTNPNFADYARAFGGHGETVNLTEEFPQALERAIASGKPSIIHCKIDPEAITPSKSLTAIRNEALSAKH